MVDWRVYARTDRHYLKTFEHETHLECHLLVDEQRVHGLPGPRPHEQAGVRLFFCRLFRVAGSAGAWSLVSLQLFDEKIRSFIPPGSSMKHLDQILNRLEHNTPGGLTSVSAALERSAGFSAEGTLVVVSDFWTTPPPFSTH